MKHSEEYKRKVEAFADLVDVQTAMRLVKEGFGNQIESNRARVVYGNKYAKVDVGSSGRFMIDPDGNIFGIKAYGVPHRGYRYGTLDTICQFDFGPSRPQVRKG